MDSAEKIFERMHRTKDGWKPQDFERLYEGFGFTKKEKANHTMYVYKKYGLITEVPRHNQLAKAYACTAVNLIEKVKEFKALENEGETDEENATNA